MLTEKPDVRCAVAIEDEGAKIIATVGIRDKGTLDIEIPKANFTTTKMMEFIDRHET